VIAQPFLLMFSFFFAIMNGHHLYHFASKQRVPVGTLEKVKECLFSLKFFYAALLLILNL